MPWFWRYKFTWKGEPIRESTNQTNKRVAEPMDLPPADEKRSRRTIEFAESARQGVQAGEGRAFSALHVPAYVLDALGAVHGPWTLAYLAGIATCRSTSGTCTRRN